MKQVEDFKDVMSRRTDEELIKIVTIGRNDYQPSAVIAAEEEMQKRQLDAAKIEQIESELKVEIEENKQLNNRRVNSLTRFIHFIIDTIIWLIIAFIISPIIAFILGFILLFNVEEFAKLIGYLILFVTFIGYYYIMEVYCKKTVAKFITRTKVVTKNGNKPNKNDILIRTFCRLIPLDRVSFLFTRNGFHDRLSDTIVIKDDKIEK
ncbi:MAG: RDD family protein [Lentimicrobiaceae bacterium]|nr:RDD family protein [Lentimicrobiaceae bacterium]